MAGLSFNKVFAVLVFTLFIPEGNGNYFNVSYPLKPTLKDLKSFDVEKDVDFVRKSIECHKDDLVLLMAMLGSSRSIKERKEIEMLFSTTYHHVSKISPQK